MTGPKKLLEKIWLKKKSKFLFFSRMQKKKRKIFLCLLREKISLSNRVPFSPIMRHFSFNLSSWFISHLIRKDLLMQIQFLSSPDELSGLWSVTSRSTWVTFTLRGWSVGNCVYSCVCVCHHSDPEPLSISLCQVARWGCHDAHPNSPRACTLTVHSLKGRGVNDSK